MRATRSGRFRRSGDSSAARRSSGSLRKNLGLGRPSGYSSNEAPWHASWSPRSCFGRPIPGRSPHWPEAPWVRSPASTGGHPASAPFGAAHDLVELGSETTRKCGRQCLRALNGECFRSRTPAVYHRPAALSQRRSSGGLPSGAATGRGGRELLHVLYSFCLRGKFRNGSGGTRNPFDSAKDPGVPVHRLSPGYDSQAHALDLRKLQNPARTETHIVNMS